MGTADRKTRAPFINKENGKTGSGAITEADVRSIGHVMSDPHPPKDEKDTQTPAHIFVFCYLAAAGHPCMGSIDRQQHYPIIREKVATDRLRSQLRKKQTLSFFRSGNGSVIRLVASLGRASARLLCSRQKRKVKRPPYKKRRDERRIRNRFVDF